MIIIKAYKSGTLTESQSKALYNKATELKKQGYTHMFVSVYIPVFSDTEVLSYTATDGKYTQQAYVGKKGALSHGIGRNNKKGYKMEVGNNLELTLANLDKFENVVTV